MCVCLSPRLHRRRDTTDGAPPLPTFSFVPALRAGVFTGESRRVLSSVVECTSSQKVVQYLEPLTYIFTLCKKFFFWLFPSAAKLVHLFNVGLIWYIQHIQTDTIFLANKILVSCERWSSQCKRFPSLTRTPFNLFAGFQVTWCHGKIVHVYYIILWVFLTLMVQ